MVDTAREQRDELLALLVAELRAEAPLDAYGRGVGLLHHLGAQVAQAGLQHIAVPLVRGASGQAALLEVLQNRVHRRRRDLACPGQGRGGHAGVLRELEQRRVLRHRQPRRSEHGVHRRDERVGRTLEVRAETPGGGRRAGDPALQLPTTVAREHGTLYAVRSQFDKGGPMGPGTPRTPFTVAAVRGL